MAGVAMLEPAFLSTSGRVDALVAIKKQLAWLAAVQQRMLAAVTVSVSGDPADQLAAEWVREDVACALRLPSRSARSVLVLADELTRRLPATLLLDQGEISFRQAQLLAEDVVSLDDATAAAVEARVLDRAPEQTVTAFRRAVKRAVMLEDPRRAEQRRRDGMAERRVSVAPSRDGMAELWALLPAEGAHAVWTALVDIAATMLHDPHRRDDLGRIRENLRIRPRSSRDTLRSAPSDRRRTGPRPRRAP